MKKAFLSLLIGFGATIGVLVAVAMPPGSWAVVVGVLLGILAFVPVFFVIVGFLRVTSRKDEIIREAFRYQYEDRRHEREATNQDRRNEREVGQKTYEIIQRALESGVRIAQMRGRDVLVYQSGKILDAERDCKMTTQAMDVIRTFA